MTNFKLKTTDYAELRIFILTLNSRVAPGINSLCREELKIKYIRTQQSKYE